MSSTEKAHDGPRRRSPLVVASVVAAVLVAGGGGAYFAAAGSGGDGAAGGRSETREDSGPAPLLALDTAGGGIAPGEPDPNGRGVVLRAAGELPDGPGRAAVHRATGSVTEAEVARLAKALGIADAPRLEGTAWKAGAPQDGSGPVLEVGKEAPGTWTFHRFGTAPGGDDCPRGKPCPDGGSPGGDPGGAVDEAAARKAAAPVLEAAGQGDAALRTDQLMGAVRVVNADPVVGGLPTYGWSTGVQVGPDGQVVGGSGRLKEPVRGHAYPVVTADEAVRVLNEAAKGDGRIGIGGCATPVPHQDELRPGAEPAPGKPEAPCRSTDDRTPPGTLTVTEAVFGLAAGQVDGRPALVPSWLFQVRGDGGDTTFTLPRTAVEPRYVKADEPPAREIPRSGDPDGIPPLPGTSYTADDRTLTVTFWGGVCDTYRGEADESAGKVTVEVEAVDPDPDRVCIAVAEEQSVKVTLDAPLGDRAVVDASNGKELPLRK
ncbi:hypothetical protein [Streptomyces sp. t39]|uniref:hypothetical protein n=1 Tax=Streptomyces sp. t39 TaxID=1828156 RepID=UPI0011CDDEBD|nr:hypothetical protein [Streptomyces sp. t39]TXS50862.1 hypothetical protein EAO77_23225 [Streptomyces sp. t39]